MDPLHFYFRTEFYYGKNVVHIPNDFSLPAHLKLVSDEPEECFQEKKRDEKEKETQTKPSSFQSKKIDLKSYLEKKEDFIKELNHYSAKKLISFFYLLISLEQNELSEKEEEFWSEILFVTLKRLIQLDTSNLSYSPFLFTLNKSITNLQNILTLAEFYLKKLFIHKESARSQILNLCFLILKKPFHEIIKHPALFNLIGKCISFEFEEEKKEELDDESCHILLPSILNYKSTLENPQSGQMLLIAFLNVIDEAFILDDKTALGLAFGENLGNVLKEAVLKEPSIVIWDAFNKAGMALSLGEKKSIIEILIDKKIKKSCFKSAKDMLACFIKKEKANCDDILTKIADNSFKLYLESSDHSLLDFSYAALIQLQSLDLNRLYNLFKKMVVTRNDFDKHRQHILEIFSENLDSKSELLNKMINLAPFFNSRELLFFAHLILKDRLDASEKFFSIFLEQAAKTKAETFNYFLIISSHFSLNSSFYTLERLQTCLKFILSQKKNSLFSRLFLKASLNNRFILFLRTYFFDDMNKFLCQQIFYLTPEDKKIASELIIALPLALPFKPLLLKPQVMEHLFKIATSYLNKNNKNHEKYSAETLIKLLQIRTFYKNHATKSLKFGEVESYLVTNALTLKKQETVGPAVKLLNIHILDGTIDETKLVGILQMIFPNHLLNQNDEKMLLLYDSILNSLLKNSSKNSKKNYWIETALKLSQNKFPYQSLLFLEIWLKASKTNTHVKLEMKYIKSLFENILQNIDANSLIKIFSLLNNEVIKKGLLQETHLSIIQSGIDHLLKMKSAFSPKQLLDILKVLHPLLSNLRFGLETEKKLFLSLQSLPIDYLLAGGKIDKFAISETLMLNFFPHFNVRTIDRTSRLLPHTLELKRAYINLLLKSFSYPNKKPETSLQLTLSIVRETKELLYSQNSLNLNIDVIKNIFLNPHRLATPDNNYYENLLSILEKMKDLNFFSDDKRTCQFIQDFFGFLKKNKIRSQESLHFLHYFCMNASSLKHLDRSDLINIFYAVTTKIKWNSFERFETSLKKLGTIYFNCSLHGLEVSYKLLKKIYALDFIFKKDIHEFEIIPFEVSLENDISPESEVYEICAKLFYSYPETEASEFFYDCLNFKIHKQPLSTSSIFLKLYEFAKANQGKKGYGLANFMRDFFRHCTHQTKCESGNLLSAKILFMNFTIYLSSKLDATSPNLIDLQFIGNFIIQGALINLLEDITPMKKFFSACFLRFDFETITNLIRILFLDNKNLSSETRISFLKILNSLALEFGETHSLEKNLRLLAFLKESIGESKSE